MTDQFSWSHLVCHIQVHLYSHYYLYIYLKDVILTLSWEARKLNACKNTSYTVVNKVLHRNCSMVGFVQCEFPAMCVVQVILM